jgi:hypothetical protein
LGPTTPTNCPGNSKVVGSAKDLKPASLMERSLMGLLAAPAAQRRKCLILLEKFPTNVGQINRR